MVKRDLNKPAAPGTADADTARERHADDILKRRTLFVRSLNYNVTSEQLSEKFSFVAPIKHATVVINPSNKESRGFGFVTFADADAALRAIKELNDADFEGRKMKVELAEPRHRQAPSGEASENKEALPIVTEIPGKPKKQDEEGKRRSPRIIIRNLPWGVQKPEQIIVHFQSFGKIKDVIIPKKRNGEMCGFAFVTMKGYKNAERAIEKMNGMMIDGRPVAVDWAVEKEEWEAKVKDDVKDAPAEKTEGGDDDEEEDEDEEDEEERGSEDEEMDDEEMDDEDMDDEDMDDEDEERPATDSTTTLFIRNLPYTATDDSLFEHFSQFGPVHYSRIVMDHATARPKGTGFVCFYDPEITNTCLFQAPKNTGTATKGDKPSLLQSEALDSEGKYTLDGRILDLSRAVDRNEADKLATVGANTREKTNNDKRRLYLVNEGMIPASSPLWNKLPVAERQLRDQSRDQRRKLLQADPNLHLSLTRLSVRNLPRWVTAKDLKQIARKAIPGFAEDMKAGLRTPLSREELARDGGDGKAAEEARRAKGVGVVKQAKVQLDKMGGRSRGYGFVEYWSHRYSLMGLRFMNGQSIPGTPPDEDESGAPRRRGPGPSSHEEVEKKKRLIVEFAVENAKVVTRRKENETRSREIGDKRKEEAKNGGPKKKGDGYSDKYTKGPAVDRRGQNQNPNKKLSAKDFKQKDFGGKRKRENDDGKVVDMKELKKRKNWNQKTEKGVKGAPMPEKKPEDKPKVDTRPVIGAAPRTAAIIHQKRMARRSKK